MKIAFLSLVFLATAAVCPAQATWYVPDDSPTIQRAIDGASQGDTVIVRPGTYFENINFNGKAIYLRSEFGPDATTIDGNQNSHVVTCQSSEEPDSILEGFTITNGRFPGPTGSGMYNLGASGFRVGNKSWLEYTAFHER